MSSNPADPSPSRTSTSAPRRPWSLAARLALLTSIASFAILTLASVQLYYRLANSLETQNRRFLVDEMETLRGLARFSDFGDTMAHETSVEPVGEEYLTHYVRLLDRDGRTIVETRSMQAILPVEVFPAPVQEGKVENVVVVRSRSGSSFIVTSVWIEMGRGSGGQRILQVALDVTNVEKILVGYRRNIAVTLLAGSLLCAGAGLAVGFRGTRSLREMTETTRHINVTSLDKRIGGADWPRELNALAGALNTMLDQLQDSFSRLYNSTANLTHKLRTPLTILRGEAEVALAQERSAEELREVIESSMEEYGRLTHLVDNIIFIAQAEAGKLQTVPIRIKADAEIGKVLEFYGPLAEEKGIALTCTGNATLTVDPALLRKAVANLLSNALTFTPPGGAVVISLQQRDDNSAELRVTDTGCGVSAEDMPKIFDRFYRVYATRFMDPHGSGLGLPLVKTIMDLHNGAIEVRSQPAKGTTVVLRFPPPAG